MKTPFKNTVENSQIINNNERYNLMQADANILDHLFGQDSSIVMDSLEFKNFSEKDEASHLKGLNESDFSLNKTSEDQQMTFPEDLQNVNMTQLISYSILFPLAAIGNLLVFTALLRNRNRKSRVNLMLLHLTLADMIVTFIFLPTEITWHLNIQWIFGNIGCKVNKSNFFLKLDLHVSNVNTLFIKKKCISMQ